MKCSHPGDLAPGFVHPWVEMGETSAYIILMMKHLGDIGCDNGGWPELTEDRIQWQTLAETISF